METMKPIKTKEEAIIGCILGTAVGDAMGLPFEGMSRARIERMRKKKDGYRFVFGYGMVSDDTEHTCMTAQALSVAEQDVDLFQKDLATRLKLWLLGVPAGIGFATLKSIVKLWVGFSPETSGVWSAGNGPAMRSAVIGVYWGHHPEKLTAFVRAATRITHTDPKAYHGALATAMAAYLNSTAGIDPHAFFNGLTAALKDRDAQAFLDLMRITIESARSGETTRFFAQKMNLEKGVTGYIYHTIPVVIHAWLTCGNDFRKGITQVIECGGDTDTTAAILGGIIGSGIGEKAIPEQWISRLCEWPATVSWMRDLGRCLAQGRIRPRPLFRFFFQLCRNMVFLTIVLIHGLRRMFPPYG